MVGKLNGTIPYLPTKRVPKNPVLNFFKTVKIMLDKHGIALILWPTVSYYLAYQVLLWVLKHRT
jgi:hypothetical protein